MAGFPMMSSFTEARPTVVPESSLPSQIRVLSSSLPSRATFNTPDFMSVMRNPVINTYDNAGQLTNYRIVTSKICRASSEIHMPRSKRGQLIITRKESKKQTAKRKFGIGAEAYSQMTIPIWNYFQHRRERYPDSPEDVKSAEEVWKNFYVEGSVVTDESEIMNDTRGEHMMLISVTGKMETYDIFGDKKVEGTRCWLILKKVKCDGRYVLNSNQAFSFDRQPIPENLSSQMGRDKTYTDRPFKLVPYSHYLYDQPPSSELLYYDEFGNQHYGLPIYIGRVAEINMGDTQTVYYPNKICKYITDDNSNIVSQPKIQLFLDSKP